MQGDAGELFLDQLFRIFDKDGDGSIDFKVDIWWVFSDPFFIQTC